MGDLAITGLLFVGLIILLALGWRIAFAMLFLAMLALYFWLPARDVTPIANVSWTATNSFSLAAVPLFIFLGEILLRSGISDDLYEAMEGWLRRVPGGLCQSNIAASAVLAATMGSSVSAAATVGTVAIPAMKARNYNKKIGLGSLAAGGTLGILIPPSIPMVIYGSVTGNSVGQLFMAGIIPGILLALTFMVIIAAWALLRPGVCPRPSGTGKTPAMKLRQTLNVLPVVVLIAAVLGSIYFGIATPTEAAAVGAVVSLIIASVKGRISWTMLKRSATDAMHTTAMVMLIMVGSMSLSYVLAYRAVPEQISQLVLSVFGTAWLAMLALYFMYLILGMFMDGISMMLITLPVVMPVARAFGLDPIWFGIALTICVELSLITPPVGMNLYVIHWIDRDSSFGQVALGALPFVGGMILMLLALTAFPAIATWLPSQMFVK